MALEVVQLENQLMKSNCYILIDWDSKSCVIIDPASENSEREIAYIESNGLSLDYIIMTHEHTDHTWGVNALKDKFPDSKIVCSELCDKYAKKASRAYFLLYYDDPSYRYELKPADIIVNEQNNQLCWHERNIIFILTPGHSYGSMCISIDNMLFTGDTIMPYPPYFNGRDSNEDDWNRSVALIELNYNLETVIYPGHGEKLSFLNWKRNYKSE